MEGKTAWEVGDLLGISERTAALHVNNATHKLDCVNKHQAVLKALRLGLIRWTLSDDARVACRQPKWVTATSVPCCTL